MLADPVSGKTNRAARGIPKQKMELALLVAAIVVGASFYYLASPDRFWRCPFYQLTGFLCPGCGSQRAIQSLLHGRLMEALALNCLAILVFLPMAAYACLSYFLRALNLLQIPPARFGKRMGLVLSILFILFWVTRNL